MLISWKLLNQLEVNSSALYQTIWDVVNLQIVFSFRLVSRRRLDLKVDCVFFLSLCKTEIGMGTRRRNSLLIFNNKQTFTRQEEKKRAKWQHPSWTNKSKVFLKFALGPARLSPSFSRSRTSFLTSLIKWKILLALGQSLLIRKTISFSRE